MGVMGMWLKFQLRVFDASLRAWFFVKNAHLLEETRRNKMRTFLKLRGYFFPLQFCKIAISGCWLIISHEIDRAPQEIAGLIMYNINRINNKPVLISEEGALTAKIFFAI